VKPWVWWNNCVGKPIFINQSTYFPPHIYMQILVYDDGTSEIILIDCYAKLAAFQEHSFGNVDKVVWNYEYNSFSPEYLAKHKTDRFPIDEKR